MSPLRSILLVGEGNFSFSASLSQLYSETETTVTATCLQSQDEALRHEGAANNIQVIEDSGTCLWVLSFICPEQDLMGLRMNINYFLFRFVI